MARDQVKVDLERVKALRKEKVTWADIQRITGISVATIWRRLKEEKKARASGVTNENG